MTDFGLGNDVTNEDKRAAAVKWHFGTYCQPEKPQPADLLVNPPLACDREHQPACGTGAFLVEAAKAIEEGKA